MVIKLSWRIFCIRIKRTLIPIIRTLMKTQLQTQQGQCWQHWTQRPSLFMARFAALPLHHLHIDKKCDVGALFQAGGRLQTQVSQLLPEFNLFSQATYSLDAGFFCLLTEPDDSVSPSVITNNKYTVSQIPLLPPTIVLSQFSEHFSTIMQSLLQPVCKMCELIENKNGTKEAAEVFSVTKFSSILDATCTTVLQSIINNITYWPNSALNQFLSTDRPWYSPVPERTVSLQTPFSIPLLSYDLCPENRRQIALTTRGRSRHTQKSEGVLAFAGIYSQLPLPLVLKDRIATIQTQDSSTTLESAVKQNSSVLSVIKQIGEHVLFPLNVDQKTRERNMTKSHTSVLESTVKKNSSVLSVIKQIGRHILFPLNVDQKTRERNTTKNHTSILESTVKKSSSVLSVIKQIRGCLLSPLPLKVNQMIQSWQNKTVLSPTAHETQRSNIIKHYSSILDSTVKQCSNVLSVMKMMTPLITLNVAPSRQPMIASIKQISISSFIPTLVPQHIDGIVPTQECLAHKAQLKQSNENQQQQWQQVNTCLGEIKQLLLDAKQYAENNRQNRFANKFNNNDYLFNALI